VTARAAGQAARAAARKITVFSAAGVVLGKLGEVDPVSLTFEELSGLIFHEAVVEYADRAEKVWAAPKRSGQQPSLPRRLPLLRPRRCRRPKLRRWRFKACATGCGRLWRPNKSMQAC
jgi:hypothetical protein